MQIKVEDFDRPAWTLRFHSFSFPAIRTTGITSFCPEFHSERRKRADRAISPPEPRVARIAGSNIEHVRARRGPRRITPYYPVYGPASE